MKTSAIIREKYGENFFKEIGAKGGKNGRTGGFYANHELARIAGAKGGTISKRTKYKKVAEVLEEPATESLLTRIKKSILHN